MGDGAAEFLDEPTETRMDRRVLLTGTTGARRAWTASMISALSMPWR